MLPSDPSSGVTDYQFRDSKFYRENGGSFVGHPDVAYFLFGKFRIGIRLAVSMAILSFAVMHVLFLRSKRQMGRIYARDIVANVKNACSMVTCAFWNWSIRKHPRNAMRFSSTSVEHEGSVSSSTDTCSPIPTFVRPFDIDLGPKPCCDRIYGIHKHLHSASDRDRSGLNSSAVPFILQQVEA